MVTNGNAQHRVYAPLAEPASLITVKVDGNPMCTESNPLPPFLSHHTPFVAFVACVVVVVVVVTVVVGPYSRSTWS